MRDEADTLRTARTVAAEYVRSNGYPAEAELIAAGKDDGSPEVRIALGILRIVARPAAPPIRRNGRRLAGEEC